MIRLWWLIPLMGFLAFSSFAQLIGEMEMDEEKFLLQTKQVNQFFRRFNGEEDIRGNRLYSTDKNFRDANLRKQYFRLLFDFNSQGISAEKVKEFVNFVNDRHDPKYLDFHSSGWIAQVNAEFSLNGKITEGVLFMVLEQENLGFKWVIDHVYFDFIQPYLEKDTIPGNRFLHPMSHELEFMNLRRVFNEKNFLADYFRKGYHPESLDIFLYETRKGNLVFRSVRNMKFHYFQVPGWYFELSFVQEASAGWRISNLVRYNPSEEQILRSYLLYETNQP